MKRITIKNLVIQFDGNGEQPVSEANDMVERINEVLQREFPDQQPQIMETSIDDDDVEMEDWGEESEED